MTLVDFFKIMIVVQVFFSIGITIISYSLAGTGMVSQFEGFTATPNSLTVDETADLVEESLASQTDIPIIELGALVFYSGNILIDLLLNFAFAIPEMLGLLVSAVSLLFNFPVEIVGYVEIAFSVVILAFYTISIIQLVVGVRSGRGFV